MMLYAHTVQGVKTSKFQYKDRGIKYALRTSELTQQYIHVAIIALTPLTTYPHVQNMQMELAILITI